MSAEVLRQAAAAIRQDCPLPEHSRAIDFIDYPAGWALQNEGSTAHDVRCSATQTGGAMLCDCEALLPPWVKWKTLLAVADWLDATAQRIEDIHDSLPFSARLTLGSLNVTAAEQAVAVARAYLGGAE